VFYPIYRLIRLAWAYRRVIALVLTIIAGLMERHREKLPQRLQGLDLARIPGVKPPKPADPEQSPAPESTG
jgi:hypothetical protein